MAHTLSPEQLEALRALPLLSMPNKVEVALAMVQAKQNDIVASDESLDPSIVSRIVNGKYSTLDIELARKFSTFFGCQTDDLFPARTEVRA